MSSNEEIKNKIAMLEGDIRTAIEAKKRSRNRQLIVKHDTATIPKPSNSHQFVKNGSNKLVRVLTGDEDMTNKAKILIGRKRVRSDSVLLNSRPVKPSQNRKLQVKDGIVYHSKGNSLIASTALKRKSSPRRKTNVVTIDGVSFVRSKRGKKLIRTESNKNVTPRRVNMDGRDYVRSKRGNLVLASQRPIKSNQSKQWRKPGWNKLKKKKHCQFYRFGRCEKGDSCKYIHDEKRVSPCNSFLKTGFCQDQPNCKLSHSRNEGTTPFCTHFERGNCTRTPCMYLHVKLTPGASVCRPFAMDGFCEKGIECLERHLYVCPDFKSGGVCPRGSSCRLPHHAATRRASSSGERRTNVNVVYEEEEDEEEDEEALNAPLPDFQRLLSDSEQDSDEMEFGDAHVYDVSSEEDSMEDEDSMEEDSLEEDSMDEEEESSNDDFHQPSVVV